MSNADVHYEFNHFKLDTTFSTHQGKCRSHLSFFFVSCIVQPELPPSLDVHSTKGIASLMSTVNNQPMLFYTIMWLAAAIWLLDE
jgi:hypothetical protein